MKTSFISSLSVQTAMRQTINQVQSELIQSQKEVVTGRHYNIGEELGATTARALNLYRELDQMNNLLSTNAIVTQRLSSTQMALETMSNAGQTALNTLVALSGSTDANLLGTAVQTLTDVLDRFTDAANTSVNGEYVLAGINTDSRPMADYMKDENGARTALRDAFDTYFGFPIDDEANVNTITPGQIQGFITDVLEPMFLDDANWATFFSTASDMAVTSRISQTEVVQTASTVNGEGFRYLAMGAILGIELLNTSLTREARDVVSDTAIAYMGKAISGIDSERTHLGLSENRVKLANSHLEAQVNILTLNLDSLEGVDVYAASTRITALTSQMEISYNLTARISALSLVNAL